MIELRYRIQLRLLTSADVDNLYPRLRIEDKEECIVLGSNPREALLMGAFDNLFSGISKGRAYALVDSGEIIGAIGFTSSGYLWALSTKFSQAQLRELWARTREITERLLKEATAKGAIDATQPYFHNIVHTRNKVALRWLQRSGLFAVFPENPVEVGDQLFYPFRSLLEHEMMPACALHS